MAPCLAFFTFLEDIISDENPNSNPSSEISEEDTKKFLLAWDQLKKRCSNTPIEINEDINSNPKIFTISFPAGRQKRTFSYGISNLKQLDKLLCTSFEGYTFLGKYHAICSFSKGTIEAAIRPIFNPNSYGHKRAFEKYGLSKDGQYLNIDSTATLGQNNVSLSIGQCHADFNYINSGGHFSIYNDSFKISGLQITRHDQALRILEALSDSFFLQLDMLSGIALGLMREPRIKLVPPVLPSQNTTIHFPTMAYNHEPMSLYWYARSARAMPLLEYLAYYQTIEYYFPSFSLVDAKEKISNILKDPLFTPDRDLDIMRIINAMSAYNRSGMPEERSQLRSVLSHCVDPIELRNYLTSNPDIVKYFSSPKHGPSQIPIRLDIDKTDILNESSERIYDIRCKIVHSKSSFYDEDCKPLFPYSPQADYLRYDIILLNYIAIKVLIATSGKLSFS